MPNRMKILCCLIDQSLLREANVGKKPSLIMLFVLLLPPILAGAVVTLVYLA
jgi:hypothetical protein